MIYFAYNFYRKHNISAFCKPYSKRRVFCFLHIVDFPYVGDFMKYHGWIERVGNQSYTCKFEAWKVATMLNRTDADMTGIAHTAATACAAPVLCGTATGSLYIAKKDQRGPQESSFKDVKHPK